MKKSKHSQALTAKEYARYTSLLFMLVATMHLVRVVTDGQLIVASWSVPTWFSLVAVAVTAYFAYAGLHLSGKK